MNGQKVRIIASYLPQFHPIPENDLWWGKGFTEWTNVGKAKPLFKGHYQPKIPADLGYYDLRLPETRQAQADLAKEYGVEGFCYWHYWFGNSRRLLERPFNEVLISGKPDFPFCLAWANHSWEDKQFNKEGGNKMLMEQFYLGEKDYTEHFNVLLPAFLDKRYIRVDDKPLFIIYAPSDVPYVQDFIKLWNKLARENGLRGIHFVAHTHKIEDIELFVNKGFDAVNIVRLFHFFKHDLSVFKRAYSKIMRVGFKRGQIFDYRQCSKFFHGREDYLEYCYPSIIPNWDHSPRSGRQGHIFINSNPRSFKKHVKAVLETVSKKKYQHRVIILKSWNEWAEGNYIEPDLRFGRGYLEALKEAITENLELVK
jgi:lipopolysaccharide biosynthesis protein